MGTRPAVDTLRDLRGGLVLDELSEKLNEIVNAVRSTGKGGTLTLKLSIKPYDKSGDILNIDDDIIAVVPKPLKGGTVMFATAEGNLSRRDSRQPELPGLTKVEGTKVPEVANG